MRSDLSNLEKQATHPSPQKGFISTHTRRPCLWLCVGVPLSNRNSKRSHGSADVISVISALPFSYTATVWLVYACCYFARFVHCVVDVLHVFLLSVKVKVFWILKLSLCVYRPLWVKRRAFIICSIFCFSDNIIY